MEKEDAAWRPVDTEQEQKARGSEAQSLESNREAELVSTLTRRAPWPRLLHHQVSCTKDGIAKPS